MTGCAGTELKNAFTTNNYWTWDDGSTLELEGIDWTASMGLTSELLGVYEVRSPSCQITWEFYNAGDTTATVSAQYFLTQGRSFVNDTDEAKIIDEGFLRLSAPAKSRVRSDPIFKGIGESLCTEAVVKI